MATKRKKKPKKRKLVCPRTYRDRRVHSSKGICYVTLASGKRKRVNKVAPGHDDRQQARRETALYRRMAQDPSLIERRREEARRAQGFSGRSR